MGELTMPRIVWQILLLLAWASTCVRASNTVPQPATVILSTPSGLRLSTVTNAMPWEAGRLSSSAPCCNDCICFDANSKVRQTMDGFGGTFNRAGAALLNTLPNATATSLLKALFDPVVGAGFTLAKVPIAANDFAVPFWYSYQTSPSSGFSVEVDVNASSTYALVPFIQRAIAATHGRGLRIQSTMDYPPQWMLDGGSSANPVNKSYYGALAQYYLDFVQGMKGQGITIEYLSLFNEPHESYCNQTLQGIRDLLVDHAAPLFKKQSPQTKLTWGEQYGRTITWQNYPALMNMPGVRDATDILFYHGYDCAPWVCDGRNTTCPGIDVAMANIAAYRAMYPEKPMWMTELCYAVEFQNYPSNPALCPAIPRADFMDGLQWGRMLFGDINAGASGWIYWNLLLNMSGGPFLVSTDHNDPEGNFQQPLIIINTNTSTYVPTACYFFMAHFSKYVVPGMKLVSTSAPGARTNTLAFVSADQSSYTVVAMNDWDVWRNVTIVFGSYSTSVTVPAASIMTVTFAVKSTPSDDGGVDSTTVGVVVALVVIAVVALGIGLVVIVKRRRHDNDSLVKREDADDHALYE